MKGFKMDTKKKCEIQKSYTIIIRLELSLDNKVRPVVPVCWSGTTFHRHFRDRPK